MKIKTGLKTDNVVLFPGFVSDGGVIHCGGRKYYTVPSFTGFMHSASSAGNEGNALGGSI